ncbi:MAG: hypothetical protein V2A73_00795 [Pseudomonadota bacterium]
MTTDSDVVTYSWITGAATDLYAAVIHLRELVRAYCAELGIPWQQAAVRDSTYFAERMRECRAAEKERRERLRALRPRREAWQELPTDTVAGEAGDFLSGLLVETRSIDPSTLALATWLSRNARFDLNAAQEHVLAHLRPGTVVDMRNLPPLSEDKRFDLVAKFVALIFLRHAGLVDLRQEGDAVIASRPDRSDEADSGALVQVSTWSPA